MGERRPLTRSDVNDELESLEFWERKNEAARDAGIQVMSKSNEPGSVDDEFDTMDEDGHRNFR